MASCKCWDSIRCVFCLYIIVIKKISHDLCVLSVSVMGFQKKVSVGGGWVGFVSYIFAWIFVIF